MKYRGIFEYEYHTEHKPPVSIDVHLHGDCVKGKIIEWEYRPLEQEPKTGHWESFDLSRDIYKCSICKCTANVPTVLGIPMFKYCPNCGCRMVEPQESEG